MFTAYSYCLVLSVVDSDQPVWMHIASLPLVLNALLFCDVKLNASSFCQVVTEKQKEFASKLDELCDSLTLTENRLIGHQHEAGHADSVSDLQQYQQEHQVYVYLEIYSIIYIAMMGLVHPATVLVPS